MADIRINALATTAASTASDDFIAVDGSANGTRKLNAYSPTFGGNLTVSGTIYPSGASATLTASVANTIIGSNGATRLQIDHGNGGWGRLQIIPQQTRADISAVLNNATTAQTLGLVGSSVEILTSGGTLAATFNSSQNTTLSGNLTVSGTGTSSVAGNLQIGGAPNIAPSTIDRYSSVNVTNVADFPAFLLSVADGTKNVRGSMYIDASTTQEQWAWDFSYSNALYPQYKWKIAGTTLATLRSNGNLILNSDGTDSGNGKLQLADHTTSAGGIGFGTDSYFYRRGTGEFVLGSATNSVCDFSGSSGNTQAIIFKKDSAETARIATPGSSTSLIFYTSSAVTALTLDSSQNATFAGNIKTAAPTGGTAATWRLGTVASVSPTSPNRTIEVQIGATTYYIHAKTTND